jgi:translation initiation factor 5A
MRAVFSSHLQMSDAEDDYDAADSGAADCTPIEAGSARKGGFLVIKGRPCKIVDMSKAKVGKHGAAKCHFIGVDIFTAKKLECICPASAGLSQPIVERSEYQLCDIADDGYLSLMTPGGEMRDDIKVYITRDHNIRSLFTSSTSQIHI